MSDDFRGAGGQFKWSFALERSLSATVFEILGSKRIGGHEFDRSGSRDVIGHVTISLPIGHGY